MNERDKILLNKVNPLWGLLIQRTELVVNIYITHSTLKTLKVIGGEERDDQ